MKKILFSLSFILVLGCTNSEFNTQGINIKTGTKYDVNGYDMHGYDRNGFNIEGVNKETLTIYNKKGYNKDGYNQQGYDKDGYNKYDLNKDGYSKEALKFHNAAWFEYFDLDPTDFEVIGLTYNVNDRNRIHYSFEKKPFGADMKNAENLRSYKQHFVKNEVNNILNNDNFKNYSDPKAIVNRDLNLKKQLDSIYKNKKKYETEFDLIKNNLLKLEKIKETFDKVLVFNKKGSEININYNPETEKLYITPGVLIDLTKKAREGKYLRSNALGVIKNVSTSHTIGTTAYLEKIEYPKRYIKGDDYEKIVIDMPKDVMKKNNYKINNFTIDFLVITNQIKKFNNSTTPTLSSPYMNSFSVIDITYEVVGIKLKYNNKTIYKKNLLEKTF
ncbi:hypothetical protein [Cetobacterium sp.]